MAGDTDRRGNGDHEKLSRYARDPGLAAGLHANWQEVAMSPEAHARLVELDAVARACREFYEYATAVLPASPLRLRCQRLAQE